MGDGASMEGLGSRERLEGAEVRQGGITRRQVREFIFLKESGSQSLKSRDWRPI